MAYNNQKNKENDNVIFNIQGAKSFVKCKMDWAGIGKLHVSFVSHSGLENGCKQLGHIEAALPFDGEDGALALGKMIANGGIREKRNAALKKARETGAKYPEPIFTYNGGSDAKADRPVMWRQVSIVPGIKQEYVFQVIEAEGEKNARGGYQKKSGAEAKRILVGCREGKLLEYSSKIEAYFSDFIANPERYNRREAPAAASDAPAQAPAPAVTQAPPAPVQNVNIPDTAYTIYDSIGNWMRVAGTPERALEMLQNAITTMKTKDGYVRRDNKEYEAAKEMILSGAKKGFNTVSLYNGDKAVQLYVTVCPYVL